MINTTIPKVPSGLEPALNDFLNAVKKQIHIREGVNIKVKDDRFITFREANKLLDDRTQTLRKQIKKDTQFKRGDSDKIDLSPLKGELTNIKGRIEDIENSRVLDLQLKEGVFVNTFLHVGPDVPSDEGWNPEGVGITGAGIYGVGPEQEGHFFLGSYDISGDFGVMAPILGHEIWAGELRVGDDISYNSNTNLLNGSDWMWYRPGVGLSINIENGGGLTVGNHTTGTGIITGPEGLFVFDQGVMVHGFSTTDGIEVSLGNHTIDRNDAMMGKYFSGTGLYWDDSAETFSIKVSSNNRRIEIDDLGLLGYNSNNDIAFGFTFEQIGDIPAGSAVFQGNIYGSEIIGTDGLTIRKEPGSTARLELDSNGLLGYNSSNELLFGFALQNVGDIPEGSGVFKGTVYAGSYINNTLAETVEHNAEVGATFTSTHAGAMAYENMVEEAKLGETIKEGGFIKTSLIDVDNLIVNNSIIVGGDSITNLTGRSASNISSVLGRRWAQETGADITSNHTAYNSNGAGDLSSGAALRIYGDVEVQSAGDIDFYASNMNHIGRIRSKSITVWGLSYTSLSFEGGSAANIEANVIRLRGSVYADDNFRAIGGNIAIGSDDNSFTLNVWNGSSYDSMQAYIGSL